MDTEKAESGDWAGYLDHSMQDLVAQAIELLDREKQVGEERYHDYSFVVFPMAKAYEGFLKKFFYDLGLIGQRQYEGRYFRIGKSLNPDLPERYRDEDWLYDDLERMCHDQGIEPIAEDLWNTWKESRNLLFHYFPKHEHFIGLVQAEQRVKQVEEMMKSTVESGLLGDVYPKDNKN